MVGRNFKQVCNQMRFMPNSCLGLAADDFCSGSMKLKEKGNFKEVQGKQFSMWIPRLSQQTAQLQREALNVKC